MNAPRGMPPFAVIAAALRKTTELLAAEVVQSSSSPPDWNELEWAIARSTAAMQGISALLANSLSWSGPAGWAGFLAEQREQSLLRDARVGVLLEQIDAAAQARGVQCVALKGAALRTLDLYRPGERPMGDIDLLVTTRDLPAMRAVMSDIEYAEAFETHRHLVFEPRQRVASRGFGEHVDNPLKIEVHSSISEALPVRRVDITECLIRDVARPGLRNYPDLISLFHHLLLHAAGNMRAHALRQIQLHDIATVASLFDEDDWRALLELPHDKERPWWLFPPLVLTARYYPNSIPLEVLRTVRAICPSILRFTAEHRSLTDVSWSNLRIHAFPGIAWSRTPVDVLRFMRSRVAPSRRSIAELELATRAQPQLCDVPWYGVSQGSRVVRWLFLRAPRVQTILSVHAALESVGLAATNAAE